MSQKIRLGIIGAGNFTRGRMLPNFQKLDDVEVVAICNRRLESAQQVAEQFEVPEVTDNYHELLERSDVDAVLIGTQPYLHREAVLEALDVGKHVLCQTRIALSADEAREMHRKAVEAETRGVKSMLARPAPYARGQKFVTHLLSSGYAGRPRQVLAFCIMPDAADSTTPMLRRQDVNAFGPINAWQLGLYWDVMAPWVGQARRVLAQASLFTPRRPESPGGPVVEVAYPDSMMAIAETDLDVTVFSYQNWAARFGTNRIELYGEEGTLVYQQQGDVILGGQQGDDALATLPIPAELDDPWHVEADFVRLIRGELAAPSFSFLDGVRNMEYLEAVDRSLKAGHWAEVEQS